MKRYILKGGFLMAKEINNDTIAKFENDLNNHPVFNVASHAAQENGIYKASQNLNFFCNGWRIVFKALNIQQRPDCF